jgi:hypothetical protein
MIFKQWPCTPEGGSVVLNPKLLTLEEWLVVECMLNCGMVIYRLGFAIIYYHMFR